MQIKLNAVSFAASMKLRSAELKAKYEKRVVNFATTLHRKLVADTPKLTGQAAANWQMQLNGADTSFLPGGVPVRLPKTVDYEGYASQAEAEIQFFQSGDSIYIYNNAPYIGKLNDGYSAKAPAGFVEAAIAYAKASVRAV